MSIYPRGNYTDTKSSVGAEVDDAYRLDLGLGNVRRLIGEPVWRDENNAQLLVQTGWVEEALLGQPHKSKTWEVTLTLDGKSTPTVQRWLFR